jgi:hypothetical protein
MLIEKIDGINLESLQRGFSHFFDMLRPAVLARLPSLRAEFETEFGSYDHMPTKRGKRFAHKLLVGEWPIGFSGIEECDTAFDSLPNQKDHFLFVGDRTVRKAHSHTSQANGRNFQITLAKFAFLHYVSYRTIHCL